ncbi:hypothetical protein PAAL109150_04845 [Paenibacillus alkaliterrae]
MRITDEQIAQFKRNGFLIDAAERIIGRLMLCVYMKTKI